VPYQMATLRDQRGIRRRLAPHVPVRSLCCAALDLPNWSPARRTTVSACYVVSLLLSVAYAATSSPRQSRWCCQALLPYWAHLRFQPVPEALRCAGRVPACRTRTLISSIAWWSSSGSQLKAVERVCMPSSRTPCRRARCPSPKLLCMWRQRLAPTCADVRIAHASVIAAHARSIMLRPSSVQNWSAAAELQPGDAGPGGGTADSVAEPGGDRRVGRAAAAVAQRGLVAAGWSGGTQPPVCVTPLSGGNALLLTAPLSFCQAEYSRFPWRRNLVDWFIA